jgi:NAD(P)H-hydrate epimerase
MAVLKETSSEFVNSVVKPRLKSSRKGDNGKVLVVGGSWAFHGAPFLASMSALRSGVDLVYVAAPKPIAFTIRALSPDLIVLPLPDLKFTKGCAHKLIKWLPNVNCVIVGPGLGKGCERGLGILIRELKLKSVSMVLDADALHYDIVRSLNDKRHVITPHVGEFSRIFDVIVPDSIEERCSMVLSKAKEVNVTILLKGQIDIISDGETILLNRTGTPAMTVGGTGDVLSGIVGAFIAKGVQSFEAAASGAYLNGRVGEAVYEKKGFHMIASDLIEMLPFILKQYDKVE